MRRTASTTGDDAGNSGDEGNESDASDQNDFRDADYLPPEDITLHQEVELRRSERQRNKPNRFGFASNAVEVHVGVFHDPETVAEALSSNDAESWNTWCLEELPKGRKAISNKWVFKRKLDDKGRIDRFKVRLVVKGCSLCIHTFSRGNGREA